MELTEKEDVKKQEGIKTKYKDSSRLIQASFIIAIIMTIITILTYGLYQGFIMGLLGNSTIIISYIIYSIFLVVAIIGTIFGGFSFKEGKNIYGIIGFIVNLLIIGGMAFYIYFISTVAHLY